MAKLESSDFVKLLNWNDLVAILFLLAFALIYYEGGRRCLEIGKSWIKLTANLWTANFAHCGMSAQGWLFQDLPNEILFHASGRKNLNGMLVTLNLIPRHDPIAYLYSIFKGTFYDKATITCTLNCATDPLVFAILSKRLEHAIKSEKDIEGIPQRWDLSFPRPVGDTNLPNVFSMYSESPEIARLIMQDQDVQRALSLAANVDLAPGSVWLEQLTVSDLPRVKPSSAEDLESFEKCLSLTFRLPSSFANGLDAETQVKEIVWNVNKLALDIVDLIAMYGKGYSTSQTVSKITSSRASIKTDLTKVDASVQAEQVATKKAEERRKELERIRSLPPAQREKAERKMEELDRKRAQKKAAKRMGGKMIVG